MKTDIVNQRPADPQTSVPKAAVLVEFGELDKAAEKVAELVTAHGAPAEIHAFKGDLLKAPGPSVEAAAEYQAACDLAPAFKTAQAYFRALLASGQTELATEFFEDCIAAHPRLLQSKHFYAQLLMSQKKWNVAQKMYEELQGDGVEDVILLNNLAAAYQHQGDPRVLPTAEAAYNKMPSDPRIADTYGWILTEHGEVKKGLALLRDAFARASTSPEIRYHIGLALARLGRNKEASEEVEAALATNEGFSGRDEASTLLESLREAFG